MALSESTARRRLRARFGARHAINARWAVARGSADHFELLKALGEIPAQLAPGGARGDRQLVLAQGLPQRDLALG